MYLDFSSLFHQSSKDRSAQGRVRIPLDAERFPEEWTTITYKSYPRFEKLPLGDAKVSADLAQTIAQRTSRRRFSKRPLARADLSALCKFSCGITREGEKEYHRAQPSGGARYPIEMYLAVFAEGEIPAGVYHYNVAEHALDALWQRQFATSDVAQLFTFPWAMDASCAVFLTGVFERNQRKYGERGYRQVLLEAGAIVENLYLVSTALDVKCCAIDGVRETNIEKLLDVDGTTESVICSLVLG